MLKQLFISFILAVNLSQSAFAMDNPQTQAAAFKALAYVNQELILASKSGQIECVKKWLAYGAQVDAKDNLGFTALIYAAGNNHQSICQLLINAGATINTEINTGINAIDLAAFCGYNQICKLLIENGAEINIKKNNSTYNCLGYASTKNQIKTIKFLIDHGAQMNINHTRLHTLVAAARAGREAACNTLITYSNFNPFLSQKEFQTSRNRIFTALCALKRMCPSLSKDLRKHILCEYFPELKKDLFNSAACGIYNHTKEDQAPFLPLPIVRILMQNGKLDEEKTVAAIKAHHEVCVSPLMFQTIPYSQTNSMRRLLNPDYLEINFGSQIEYTIKERLELLTRAESATHLLPAPQCVMQ